MQELLRRTNRFTSAQHLTTGPAGRAGGPAHTRSSPDTAATERARQPKVDTFPVIVRDLISVQVLDTMLTDNAQRADLTLTESIRAVARCQLLAPGDSPTKIARRIGHTPTWVKSRRQRPGTDV